MEINLYNDDCLKILKTFSENSIDSIITDPPYGIKFMNKKWDYNIPSIEIWKECLRVLKPGGHILVACGTKTQHRMACNIEDSGFEIRDLIAWIYGSGFPKSLNIGKVIDELQENERKSVGEGISGKTRNVLNASKYPKSFGGKYVITEGIFEYEGWGTGLKPAMELWTLARKPLSENTVAENVLKHGTGGINIDECRVETKDTYSYKKCGGNSFGVNKGIDNTREYPAENNPLGRFPANVIHDGSEEVLELFPETKTGGGIKGNTTKYKNENISFQNSRLYRATGIGANEGSAARFFYCAKASNSERNENLDEYEKQITDDGRNKKIDNPYLRGETKRQNTHPTIKPIELMKYLCRLITPKNGIILDPFMGSGSTGIASKIENFDFIGIEIDEQYFKIAETRINNIQVNHKLI